MKATLKSYSFFLFAIAASFTSSAAYNYQQEPAKVKEITDRIVPVVNNVIDELVTPLVNLGVTAATNVAVNVTNNVVNKVVTGNMRIIVDGNEAPVVEKKKVITKTYTLGTNDLVTLDNRFGEIKIGTWDKNEIRVEITMTAKGSTEARATDILDRISIEEGKTSEGYRFRTDLDSKNDRRNNNNTFKDEGFSINYDVMMPSKTRLNVANEFGATTIPDYNGLITITSKFGALSTGKLSNSKRVWVEFGSASIDGISNGDLTIKFSRAIVSNIDGSVKANFEHCNGVLLNIDNNLKGLVIKNDFTNLQLNVNKSFSAKYNITTNFGEFRNKTDFDISNYDEDDNNNRGPVFKKRFTGKSGGGDVEFKVSAEFSNITIGHSLKMELKDEKKDKKGTASVNI